MRVLFTMVAAMAVLSSTACAPDSTSPTGPGTEPPTVEGLVTLRVDALQDTDRALRLSIAGPATEVTLGDALDGVVARAANGDWDVVILSDSPLSARPLVTLRVPDRRAMAAYRVTVHEIANGSTYAVRGGEDVTPRFVLP